MCSLSSEIPFPASKPCRKRHHSMPWSRGSVHPGADEARLLFPVTGGEDVGTRRRVSPWKGEKLLPRNVCSRFLEESSWERLPVRLLVMGFAEQREWAGFWVHLHPYEMPFPGSSGFASPLGCMEKPAPHSRKGKLSSLKMPTSYVEPSKRLIPRDERARHREWALA